MNIHSSIKAAAFAVAFLLASTVSANPAYSQDESITVSCYKGNTDEGNYIGDITVNNAQNAGNECNREYDDCQGECLGCVLDSDFNQVCYDNDGKKFPQ